MRRILFVIPLLVLVGCKTFTSNPGTNMTIVNHAASPIHGIEVNYPGGVIGAPQIAAGASIQKWVPTKECKLEIKFMDASDRDLPQKEVNLGQVCPKNVTIEIASDMSVTARGSQ
jgi:hypothetical protein